VVVGMNSIAVYCMTWLIDGWMLTQLKTHLGEVPFQVFGLTYQPLLENLAVGLCIWLLAWWMFRRRLFLRV
jgi:hypothetical protein